MPLRPDARPQEARPPRSPVAVPEVVPPPPASPGLANAPAQRLSLVEYRDTPLSEAIRLFSEQTGLNVVASPDARKIPVSLYLRNVTAETALATLCKSNSLWFRQDAQSGVVTIYTTKEYQSDLASFREEQTEVFTLLYPNPVDVATAIRSIYGNRVVLNTESQWQDVYQDLEERFDRFDIVDGRSQGLGLFQGGTGAGLGGTSGGYGTGGLGGTGYGGAGGAYGGRGGGYAGQGAGGYAGVRRQDLLSENRAARQETTKQIPPREEFKISVQRKLKRWKLRGPVRARSTKPCSKRCWPAVRRRSMSR